MLTQQQQKTYHSAISRGLFEGYDESPRAWKHSLCGAYKKNYSTKFWYENFAE